MTQDVLICAHCQTTLIPGSGQFWEVRIDAVADPWPPEFTEEELQHDARRSWRDLVEQLNDVSPQEAMDQVHRHTVLHLCNPCFDRWYGNPAG